MASDYDTTEFVDTEVQTYIPATAKSAPVNAGDEAAAPTQEELDSNASDVQGKLAKLKRKRDQLETERSELEEAKRRRSELTQSHKEMLHHLTRGVGILEEEAITARRDAEQADKTLEALQNALEGVSAIDQDKWTKTNWTVELTKAQTAVENARHEWNSARMKYVRLDSVAEEPVRQSDGTMPAPKLSFTEQSFAQLCRLGFALTWPIATAIIAVLLVMLFRS